MTIRSVDTGTPELLCEIRGHVATLTLNRPAKRNALSDRMTPALRAQLLALEADEQVRCIVLTGAGSAFCAGGDVGAIGATADAGEAGNPGAEAAITELRHRQRTLALRLFELAKPTVAALPGAAAGAGLSIALACDLRLAAESAFVTTAFGRIGLSGDYGGSWLLTQLVGPSRAKELYYTSRRVAAGECLALGIVNEVVPDDALAARAAELARALAAQPPLALRYMKENVNRALTADFASCLDLEADRLVRTARTEDHRRAVRAFLDKTTATYEGR